MRGPEAPTGPHGVAAEARTLADTPGRGAFELPPPKYRPPPSRLEDSGNGTKKFDHRTFKVAIARDGSPTIKDKPSVQHLYGPVFLFDVTDWAMRQAGIDPYAYEKRKLLDETREERAQMSAAARTERLREAQRRLPTTLAAVWADPRHPTSARRRLLFQLWDECAEQGHDEVVAAGARVRAIILAFIRTRLPAGSRDAYTVDELETLNATRTSRATFSPY